MKTTILLVMAAAMTLTATAAGPAAAGDTLLDVRDAHRVILTENDTVMRLRVAGCGSDKDFSFDYSKTCSPEAAATVEQRASKWNFSLPLSGKKQASSWEMRFYGIGFGFVSAVNAPEGLDVDMSSSYEIFWDMVGATYLWGNQKNEVSVAFGLNWRNYRMTGRTRFIKDADNNISLDGYPGGADIQFSRIKVFSMTFPLRYRYNFTKKFSASLAAILNVNSYASVKTRYKLDGRSIKEFDKNIHQKPVTLDLMASVCCSAFGIYAKYSPCDVLNSAFGPSFRSFSAGVSLFF